MKKPSKEIHAFKKNVFLTAALTIIFLLSGGTAPLKASSSVVGISEQQQTIQIKGVVADRLGEPIIGASIREKGQETNGTLTDLDGKFTLNVRPNATLIIAYVGYQTIEVAAEADMKITLRENDKLLEEVVVIGYGVQKKKLITGATVQVKGDDVAKLSTTSALEAMQSQSPGVSIVQNDGFIGSGYKVNIRGIGTNGYSAPLYVIDGVAGGDINAVSPTDIESIDILKDAATAAIYGARAANGVILITTKRGHKGDFSVTYDGYYGVQNLYKMPTILNAKEFMTMQDESRVMNGNSPYDWSTFLPAHDLQAINNGTWSGTNWLKEILNTDAPVQSHAVSFAGGNERSTFSIGLSYLGQEATMGVPGAFPKMNRYNARVNSDHIMIKKGDLNILKVGESISYRFQDMDGNVPRGDIYWNTVRDAIKMSPLMHVYNSQGGYYMHQDAKNDGYAWDMSGGGNRNPIAYMDYAANQNISRSHFLNTSIYTDLQPIKNLHLKTQFGFKMGFSSYRAYTPAYGQITETLSQDKDRVTQSMSNYHRWTWENTASYSFNINDHKIDALLGQSMEKWGMGESLSGSSLESSYYDFKYAYLSNVPSLEFAQSLAGSPNSPGSIASFFGRASYSYKEKYMATAIMRADGSSIFPRGNRWGYFPSLSAGWVITNEDFMSETSDWLEFLKLRASYGQNGNCQVSAFQYMSPIASNNTWGGYPFGGSMDEASVGAYAARLVNKDIKWETQEQLNLGLDARFLRGRLGLELDWYRRTTKDWLVDAAILGSFGTGTVYINGGDVRNQGFETALHWNDNVNKDFDYGINLGLAYNKNEVIGIGNEEKILHGSQNIPWWGAEEIYRAEVGKPFGYFYGYETNGIFQNQKQIDEYNGPLLLGKDTQPGDVIWKDSNGDGILDEKDRTMIGDPHPDFTIGLNFNVSWKGFDLSVNTYTALGHQIFKSYRDYVASPNSSFTTDIFKRWHGEGTSNTLPRLTNGTHTNWSRISDIYIEDADYMKIKNITFGYDFKKLFKNIPMQQLRIYLTAQNLFTITGYSGMDPEIGYSAGESWASGVDLGAYPSARTFMVGANIKF